MAKDRQIVKISDVFDDMAVGLDFFDFNPFRRSYSFGGQIVDTEKYDIIPKLSHYETLITKKQEQIEALERQHESNEKYYEERLRTLKQEKETLLRDRDNRTLNKSG